MQSLTFKQIVLHSTQCKDVKALKIQALQLLKYSSMHVRMAEIGIISIRYDVRRTIKAGGPKIIIITLHLVWCQVSTTIYLCTAFKPQQY